MAPCRVVVVAALLSLVLRSARAAECHGAPDPNAKMNTNPISTGDPVFVRSVPNGALYTVGDADDAISVVHLWGSAYEKGFAHGQLMQGEAQSMLNATWSYFMDQVEQALNGTAGKLGLSPAALELISEFGLEGALDLTYYATKDFTGDYFWQEMRGLSDASGVDYDTIRRIHMIGELTKGSCSMYGAWGAATPDGGLLQLRALDWAADGPFRNYPQITVYHSNGSESEGNSFANFGWTGWLGSITGMSELQMAISEIGAAFPDSTFGPESRFGVPFTFLLRDILQFTSTLQEALDHITDANRTCDLILGVGDAKAGGGFRGIEYSHSVANFFTDVDNHPVASWHPDIENVVYYGMDWLCPNYDTVLSRQLQALHGQITPAATILNVTSIVQTGDLLVAVYDLSHNMAYISNAAAEGESGPAYAYDRAFVQVDMAKLFSVSPPAREARE